MEAKQNSNDKAAWKRGARLFKKSLVAGNTSATRFLDWTSTRVLPWCQSHLLSLAVLMAFPMGIAAFFWGNADSEKPAEPAYLQTNTQPESLPQSAEQATQHSANENGKVSHVSLTLEAPELLSPPSEPESPEFTLPQPLPIAIDGPGHLNSLENRPLRTWNPTVPADYQATSTSGDGVWFIGTIDDSDLPPKTIQNASRVHELTNPQRN